MPTAADEFEPPAELIQSLLASEVLPRLASIEKDGCPQLFAQTFIVVRDHKTLIGVFGSSGELDIQPNGELRMRIRKTINENRVVWRIESLSPNVMPSTGFVGFDSNGDAIGREGQWIVRPNAWCGKYNVDDWHGWK